MLLYISTVLVQSQVWSTLLQSVILTKQSVYILWGLIMHLSVVYDVQCYIVLL